MMRKTTFLRTLCVGFVLIMGTLTGELYALGYARIDVTSSDSDQGRIAVSEGGTDLSAGYTASWGEQWTNLDVTGISGYPYNKEETRTFRLYANAKNGYYFTNWSYEQNRTTVTTGDLNNSETFVSLTVAGGRPSKRAECTFTANFSPVTVTGVQDGTPQSFTHTSISQPYTGTIVFTQVGGDAAEDFTFSITSSVEDGAEADEWSCQFVSADPAVGTVTVGFTYTPHRKTFAYNDRKATATLYAKGLQQTQNVSCDIQINFPKPTIQSVSSELITATSDEDATGTAVFEVQCADGWSDFMIPANITPNADGCYEITNDNGVTWKINPVNITLENSKLTIPYTFNANGKENAEYSVELPVQPTWEGATPTVATLRALVQADYDVELYRWDNYPAEGNSKQNNPVINEKTGKNEWTWEDALAYANAHTYRQCPGSTSPDSYDTLTIQLMRNVEVAETQVVQSGNKMCIDLNGFVLSRSLKAVETDQAVIKLKSKDINGEATATELSIKDSKSIGKIVATGAVDGNLYALQILDNGCYLRLYGIKVEVENTFANTDNPSGYRYATAVYVGLGGKFYIYGGELYALHQNGTHAYGVYVEGNNGETSASTYVYMYDGTKVEAIANAYVYGVYAQAGAKAGVTSKNNITICTYKSSSYPADKPSVITATATNNEAYGIYATGNADREGDCSVRIQYGQISATAVTNAYGVYAGAKTTVDFNQNAGKATATAQNKSYGVYLAAPGTKLSIGNYENIQISSTHPEGTDVYGVYVAEDATITSMKAGIIEANGSNSVYGVYLNNGASISSMTNGVVKVDGSNNVYGIYAQANTQITIKEEETNDEIEIHAAAQKNAYGIRTAGVAILTPSAVTATATDNYAYAVYLDTEESATAEVYVVDGQYKASAADYSYAVAFAPQTTVAPTCIIGGGKFWGWTGAGNSADIGSTGVVGNVQISGGYYHAATSDLQIDKYVVNGYRVSEVLEDDPEKQNGYLSRIRVAGDYVCNIYQYNRNTANLVGAYMTLEEALQYVKADQAIVMIKDYTLPKGNYSLKSGTTLLVPYEANQKQAMGEKPETIEKESAVMPSPFITLTFASGAILNAAGTIELSGLQNATVFGRIGSKYGHIELNEGATINLESGAKLMAWGYVTGDGRICAKNGSTISEFFQMADWKGGSQAMATVDKSIMGKGGKIKSLKLFPISHYFYQNIESIVEYQYGAKATGVTAVSLSIVGVQQLSGIEMLGSQNALFCMTDENTIVTKKYSPDTDRIQWNVRGGNAKLGNIELHLSYLTSIDIYSKDYRLPLASNMDVVLESDTFTISQDAYLMPATKLVIEKNAVLRLDNSLFVLDMNEWQKHMSVGIGNYFIYNPYYSYSRGKYWNNNGTTVLPPRKDWETNKTPAGKDPLPDAEISVKGAILLNGGNFYTSTSGANIWSTDQDGGKLIYSKAMPEPDPSTKFSMGTGAGVQIENGNNAGYAIANMTPAQLRNQDDSFTLLDNKEAGLTYTYQDGEWQIDLGCRTFARRADGEHYYIRVAGERLEVKKKPHTDYSYFNKDNSRRFINTVAPITGQCTWIEVAEPVVFNGVSYYQSLDNAEVLYLYNATEGYWESGFVGAPLDVADATATPKTIVINLNDDAVTAWSVSAGSTSYDETDKLLTITLDATVQPDDKLLIETTGADNEVTNRNYYTVPHVVATNATLSAADLKSHSVVFVQKDAVLTLTGDVAVETIVVQPGGELVVNGTLTVNSKLVLRTSPQAAAVLTNNGTIEGQVYYSRIVRNAERLKLFQIALPFDVTLNDIMLSNGKRFDYSKTIGLMEYNAARRAQKGPDGMNWKGINPNEITTMSGSKGYQLLSTLKAYNEYYFPVTLSEQTQVKVETQDANDIKDIYDAGWNFLCSPSAGRVDVSNTDPANQLKIYEYVEAEGNQPAYYKQSPATILQPAMPFFYQTAANGSLMFENSIVSFEPVVATQQAPRRLSAQNVPTQWLQLYYGANENMADQTNIYLHPMRFTTEYQPGYDGVKMSTSGTRPFVWSSLSYGELAFAALPDSVATEMGIALTVFAPTAQAMTFSLRENDWLSRLQSVYLLDREQQTLTDLLQNDYSYDAAAGTTAGRFVVYPMFRAPDMTDGVELPDMTVASFTAYGTNREIWVNGLSAGMALRCYDLTGRLVYGGTADSGLLTIAVPAPGIYFVQAMDEVQKVIVK